MSELQPPAQSGRLYLLQWVVSSSGRAGTERPVVLCFYRHEMDTGPRCGAGAQERAGAARGGVGAKILFTMKFILESGPMGQG